MSAYGKLRERLNRKDKDRRLTVMFLGLRGIGSVQGGVETHVTELVRHLPIARSLIEVVGRRRYRGAGAPDSRLPLVTWLPSPASQALEAPVHTLVGVVYAAIRRPKILHIHSIGPGIAIPLARALGLRVVATHHGEDYRREKWGPLARLVLRCGEWFAVRLSHACISVSEMTAVEMSQKYHRAVQFIPNGAPIPCNIPPGPFLQEIGLNPQGYILQVARIVPEKRQVDLLEAFASMPPTEGIQLALVGGGDLNSAYQHEVSRRIEQVPRSVLLGHLSGAPLREVYSNARLFILPSSHEGMPIVVFEAMSYGLPILVSNIPAHRALALPENVISSLETFPAFAPR